MAGRKGWSTFSGDDAYPEESSEAEKGGGRFMKGWPVARALFVLLVLLLAGLPLRSLTRPRNELPPAPVAPLEKTEKLTIEVTFTQPPEAFSVVFLGQEVLAAQDPVSFDFSTTLQAHFPPEGIDLVFQAKWRQNFKRVGANIQVIREDGSKQTQNLSGTKELFEVLTFPGKTAS